MSKLIYVCNCYCEGITVDGGTFGDVDIAVWNQGIYDRMELSFKDKLKMIWRIIKGESLWRDFISLNIDEAENLREALKEEIVTAREYREAQHDDWYDQMIANELLEEAQRAITMEK